MSKPSNNQYAPPQSPVADMMPLDGTATIKASRSSRLGAAIIDGLVFSLPFAPAYMSALGTTFRAGHVTAFGIWAALIATGMLFYLALLVDLVLGVVVAVMVHRNAQSIGKRLCGIKVARSDGSRATLARIFWLRNVVNYLIRFVPMLGPLYGLVDLLMIFGEQRRCCHDYIADTIVIQA
ncbi:MAG TPA: RDD family protein [Steroidobacteraceae bacterium]|nr:RDD family protein [Steroidobacteraceae bacterium]